MVVVELSFLYFLWALLICGSLLDLFFCCSSTVDEDVRADDEGVSELLILLALSNVKNFFLLEDNSFNNRVFLLLVDNGWFPLPLPLLIYSTISSLLSLFIWNGLFRIDLRLLIEDDLDKDLFKFEMEVERLGLLRLFVASFWSEPILYKNIGFSI